ncbi:cyclase family protein [Halomarina ordinaria]|uniref:Cyclase family protein n=1 Tax=Halomarina ordinaria TaxID=3033939 RepID=A0ABD5UBM1_9EURY|nr:cyclase family protein [Halomarina sp. PSRA2]
MSERDITEVLADAPSNWGKWGDDDETGALNYLTEAEVLRGVQAVEHGRTFTLGLPIGRREGDPVWPGRSAADHYMELDKGHFESGKFEMPAAGGLEYADDVIYMFLQGTTQFDALGHVWYDDQLYNGFDAGTTKGGMGRCSIEPMADHGVVGRGVLLDVARHRGRERLDRGERITLDDLEACADEQGVDLRPRDIPLIRTGWIELFYEEGEEAFYGDEFDEPGITYSDDLVEWFHEMEIPAFGTDTIANEQTVSDETETLLPLHGALLRDQGVAFNEINRLDELADDCAEDGKYDFLYVGSPLKIVGGTGSPVNPIAIK